MGATSIEWTDAVWQVTAGCEHAGRGCRCCYAEVIANRQVGIAAAARAAGKDPGRSGDYDGVAANGKWTGLVKTLPHRLADPLGWRKPRVIFVDSMADLFHDAVPDAFIAQAFGVMAGCPQHVFIVLTKRIARASRFLRRARPSEGPWPLPNVIIGASVWDQSSAEAAAPYLFDCPAACRMISAEPLLGPLDLTRLVQIAPAPGDELTPTVTLNALTGHVVGPDDVLDALVGWVVCGGQSGPGASPCHPAWARSLRDQCASAGVPFFYKQGPGDHGDTLAKMPVLDGAIHAEVPDAIRRLGTREGR